MRSSYKLHTLICMGRRNREDYLTRNRRSPNWYLNFRVPESHQSRPPFIGRSTFQCSTGTADYKEACIYRDTFFEDHGLFVTETCLDPSETYWKTFTGTEPLSSEEEDALLEVHEESTRENQQPPEPYKARLKGHNNKSQITRNPALNPNHPYPLILSALADNYLAYREDDFSKASKIKVTSALKAFQSFCKNDVIDISSITKHLVFSFVQSREKAGYSASTISSDLSFLGQVYNYAQLQGLITDLQVNPFRDQRIRSKDKKTRPAMPLEHAQKLFKSAPDSELKVLVALGHYAGLRLSEAYSVRISKDGDRVTLNVAEDGGKTKSATREIPAHDQLWEIILELKVLDKDSGNIKWKTPNASSLGKRFGRFKKHYFTSEGIDDGALVFHSFRHAFSTYLVNNYDELKASELTGHDKGSSSGGELGRTYYKGLDWKSKKEMIQSIPALVKE